MDERRKNPSEIFCIWHTGIEEKIAAACRKMEEKEKKFDIQISAMEKALSLARDELNRRLEDFNNLRHEFTSDRGRFLTTDVHESWKENVCIWQNQVNTTLTKLETRSITWGAAIALVVILLNLGLHLWK